MARPSNKNRYKDERSVKERTKGSIKAAGVTLLVGLAVATGATLFQKAFSPSSPTYRAAAQEVTARAPKASAPSQQPAPHGAAKAAPKASAKPVPKSTERWLAECRELAQNREKIKAYYEEEADVGLMEAQKNGFLSLALAVEEAQGDEEYPVYASNVLTVGYLESTLGKFKGKANGTTGEGAVQYTEAPFLEDFGRFLAPRVEIKVSEKASAETKNRIQAIAAQEKRKLKRFRRMLEEIDPSIVDEAYELASFVRFDVQTSKVFLDENAYQAAQSRKWFGGDKKGSLRDSILNLRKGDKGQSFSTWLAFSSLKRKVPYLIKKMVSASIFGETAKVFGDSFLLDMVHNWGFDGTLALFDADPNKDAGKVIDPATLGRNGFKDPHVSVGYVIVKIAQKCYYLDQRFKLTARNPKLAEAAQKERIEYRKALAREEAKKAKERKAAQEALTKPTKKSKDQAMFSPSWQQNGGGQRAFAQAQNRPGGVKKPVYSVKLVS